MGDCARRRPRRLAAAVPATVLGAALATVLATGLVGPGAGAAAAAPPVRTAGTTADATARATLLRAQVEDLEERVEVAAEDSGAAEQDLTAVVSQEIGAQRDLDATRAVLEAGRAQAGRRARAVQQLPGGRLGLALGVLRGGDPDDVLDRYRAVASLVTSDRRAVAGAARRLDAAVAASRRVQDLRRRQQALEAAATGAGDRARAALAQRAVLLAAADAEVAALAEADRERREEQAAAGAAAGVAALGADPASPAPSGAAAVAIGVARSRLGSPYAWGATGPDAFDCSGLVQWAYARAGVALPRTTRQLYAALPQVPLADLAPGDLVLYASGGAGATPATIHHVGLYLGGGLMVHAPHTGDVVRVAAVTREDVYAAVRPVGA